MAPLSIQSNLRPQHSDFTDDASISASRSSSFRSVNSATFEHLGWKTSKSNRGAAEEYSLYGHRPTPPLNSSITDIITSSSSSSSSGSMKLETAVQQSMPVYKQQAIPFLMPGNDYLVQSTAYDLRRDCEEDIDIEDEKEDEKEEKECDEEVLKRTNPLRLSLQNEEFLGPAVSVSTFAAGENMDLSRYSPSTQGGAVSSLSGATDQERKKTRKPLGKRLQKAASKVFSLVRPSAPGISSSLIRKGSGSGGGSGSSD